jgi:hypothetical protein
MSTDAKPDKEEKHTFLEWFDHATYEQVYGGNVKRHWCAGTVDRKSSPYDTEVVMALDYDALHTAAQTAARALGLIMAEIRGVPSMDGSCKWSTTMEGAKRIREQAQAALATLEKQGVTP